MKRVMIITTTIFFLLILSNLLPVTWEIRQDGTGDFTTISEGITAAQDGDTVLVYPGIYYERINFQGKNIIVTSLYDGDQFDETYIANTVIDGNHQGTVVTFRSNETRNAVLNGFTIRNGLGSFHPGLTTLRRGGGILVYYASPTISHCHIQNNRAFVGGGISLVTNGSPLLKGNIIRYNHSVTFGGIVSGMNTNIEFCPESLNNIYMNYGSRGTDLFIGDTNQSSIIIDTMTVQNPDRYFVIFREDVPSDFELIVNNGKIEPVAADLYVNPAGCDTNSGLSPEDPLRTIAMAMIKIQPDSLQQRAVHLAEGIYSRSLSDQLFPISPRSYIDITGANKVTTILDMEGETLAFHSFSLPGYHFPCNDHSIYTRNYTIKNLSIANGSNPMGDIGRGAIYLYHDASFTLENIDIYNCHTGNHPPEIEFGYQTIKIFHSKNITLKNLSLYDNSGCYAVRLSNGGVPMDAHLENLRIRHQQPGPPYPPFYTGGSGGGLRLFSIRSIPERLDATIVNVEVSDNQIYNISQSWPNDPVWSNLDIFGTSGKVRIINSTLGNNSTTASNAAGITFGGSLEYELINSIVYGNTPRQITIDNDWVQSGNVCISHSLVQGGEDDIFYFGNPNTIVHWGEGNIDADPLWVGEIDPDYDGDYPYMLSEFSPARNAGTLDIPDFEFPEYDLAGNPRIYCNSIDMGAYEWNPDVGVENYDEVIPDLSIHDYKLHNYPNPVVSMKGMGRGEGVGTTISFVMPLEGEAVIDIYNLKGQFVRRLFNAFVQKGEYEVLWNGRDEQERLVSTGFYMYRLQINGETVATGRCTFVK